MSGYKIKARIEIIETDTETNDEKDNGCFEISLSEVEAGSIDDCEQALLQVNYEAMRESLSVHLSDYSKKKPNPLRRPKIA